MVYEVYEGKTKGMVNQKLRSQRKCCPLRNIFREMVRPLLQKIKNVKLPEENSAENLLKETLAQVFSREFCEIFKNTFFTEHLRTTVSVPQGFIHLVSMQNFPKTNIS